MAKTEDRPEVGGEAEEWRQSLYAAAPERQGELFSTISGLENEPLYTAESVPLEYDRDLGYPGVLPVLGFAMVSGLVPAMSPGVPMFPAAPPLLLPKRRAGWVTSSGLLK